MSRTLDPIFLVGINLGTLNCYVARSEFRLQDHLFLVREGRAAPQCRQENEETSAPGHGRRGKDEAKVESHDRGWTPMIDVRSA